MSRILNYQQIMLLCKSHNSIHVTSNTCIVNHSNHLGLLIDQWLNQLNLHIRIFC